MLVLFFLSGVCGLIYEIVWTRLFTIVIGNTVFSVSVVLAAFMTGLALGSKTAGRIVDRKMVALVPLYAALEAGTGVFNLLLPFLLKAAAPVFGAVYVSAYRSTVVLGFTRAAISFALLIIPATLLGATLPVLTRFYSDAGRVYAVNTLGAAVGAALGGLVLIPKGGTTFALYFAACLNLLIALAAWNSGDRHRIHVVQNSVSVPRITLLFVAMFLSGFAALVDEVAWTRVLALIVGPTTYAFTLMLCAMIAGLGIGAAIGSRVRRTHLSTFAWIQVAVSCASLALIPAFGRMPLMIVSIVRRYAASIATLQAIEFAVFFALLLVPTVLFGMTFPIAARLYATSDAKFGTDIGAIYASNTAGGIVGSLAAGFLLIPLLGSQSTLIVAGLLNVVIGLLISRRFTPVALCLGVLAVSFFIPKWNPELMSSGPYKYAPIYAAGTDPETMLTSGDLLYFKEGVATTVSVRKYLGTTSLAVDGKVDATDSGDMSTQKMLAHLPLLVAREPKTVAIIGLGSGVTAASALTYPIGKLDVVEISPEVVEASRFFSHVIGNALKDPRTELIIGDGRNHLRYTNRKYDVIISEPSNPWMSGMASLFTREFFAESRARLNPGGIHCQWFHSYNMSLDDIRSVVATFRSVFPHAALWSLNEYDLLLLGADMPVSLNTEPAGADLASIRIQDAYTINSSFLLQEADLDRFSQGAVLNTDNRPVLEFRAPLSLYSNTTESNLAAIKNSSSSKRRDLGTSENHRHKAEALVAAEAFDAAEKLYETALHDDSSPSVRLSAASFYSQRGQYMKAIALLDQVLASEPANREALEKLADALAETGDSRLAVVTERLLALDADNAIGLYHLASIRLYQNRFDEAIAAATRSAAIDAKSARTRNVLAIAYDRTFQPERAEAEFRRAMAESPGDWVTLNNYGIFLLGRNRSGDAAEQFRRSIDLNPENPQAFTGIVEAFRRAGNTREAEKWQRKARKM